MKISIYKTKYCKWCGMEFIPNTPSRIYCCDRCQAAAAREKRKIWCRKNYNDLYGTTEERSAKKKPRFRAIKIKKPRTRTIEERARRQKETGVSAGILEAYKEEPERLKSVIQYMQKCGYAKPCNANTLRIFGYKDII